MSTDQKTIDWYNEHAGEYAEHVRNLDDSIYHSYYEKPAMYGLVPDIRDKKVVSLGCGSGEDSNHLKELGARESVGVDVSRELIKIAQESHPECQFEIMDMEHLSFADEEFDFAYSSLAIHYIEDWTNVFKGVFRILKPNSYFLFSCRHSVSSAMVMTENNDQRQMRQLALIKYKEPKRFEIVGDYFTRRILTDGLGNLGDVTAWHKPISEIVDEARSAGFLVERFVEPLPLPAMKNVSERDYFRLSKVPEFMIFRLVKSQSV